MAGILSNLKPLFFLTLFLTSSYKFFGENKTVALDNSSFSSIQILGILIFFSVCFFSDLWKKNYRYEIDFLLFIFFITALFSSLINFEFISLAYTSIFFLNTIFIFSIFKIDISNKRHLVAFLLIITVILFLQYYFFPVNFLSGGRQVGNFHPNHWSVFGICILSLIMFFSNNSYTKILFLPLALFFPLSVISRGGFFTLAIFVILYILLTFLFKYKKNNLQSIFKFFITFFFISIFFSPIITSLIYNFLDFFEIINSTSRGLDSGFTGRQIYWDHAKTFIYDKPLLGYGLNNFPHRVHNLYLLLLLETGLLGLSVFLISISIIIFNSFSSLFHNYNEKVVIALSFVIAGMAYGYIERIILEFSQPFSLTFFFFLAFLYDHHKKLELSTNDK